MIGKVFFHSLHATFHLHKITLYLVDALIQVDKGVYHAITEHGEPLSYLSCMLFYVIVHLWTMSVDFTLGPPQENEEVAPSFQAQSQEGLSQKKSKISKQR